MNELIVETPADGVVELRLNRPDKGNALNASLVERLHDACDAAMAAEARVLLISGAGAHFCTGFDLAELETSSDAQLLHRFIRIELLLQKIRSVPMLTACHAHGRTVGAGADIVVSCERRLAKPGTILSFPGSGFGIVLGTGRLASRVGIDRARDFVRTGRQIGADEAVASGLLLSVIAEQPAGDLVSQLAQSAGGIDLPTASALCGLTAEQDDRDLAALVRSAIRPGLGARMAAFRASKMRDRQR